MALVIKCNNIPRQMVYGYDLPDKIKKDFDHVEDLDSADFFKYKNQYYYLGDFLSITAFNGNELIEEAGFDGYTVDSAFNGLLCKLDPNDSDNIIIGQWFDH